MPWLNKQPSEHTSLRLAADLLGNLPDSKCLFLDLDLFLDFVLLPDRDLFPDLVLLLDLDLFT